MKETTPEYVKGQLDCEKGSAAKLFASDDYNRGYGDQYNKEQALFANGAN